MLVFLVCAAFREHLPLAHAPFVTVVTLQHVRYCCGAVRISIPLVLQSPLLVRGLLTLQLLSTLGVSDRFRCARCDFSSLCNLVVKVLDQSLPLFGVSYRCIYIYIY